MLNVFTRAALQEAADTFKATLGAAPPYKVGVGPFSATWDGWKAYYEVSPPLLRHGVLQPVQPVKWWSSVAVLAC